MTAFTSRRLVREYRTMAAMVRIYCADHHPESAVHPCPGCEGFLSYASKRLEKCPYGEDKPTCARCPIHCYKRVQREQARTIMRYAGPRMTWRHPWLALLHVFDRFRPVEDPMERRRRLRAAQGVDASRRT